MPFGMVSGVSRGMGVLDGLVIVEGERAVLGVNLGHHIVTNWDFVAYHTDSCVEVREPIKVWFGVVSVFCPGIGVLDGDSPASSRRGGVWEVLWSFLPHLFEWCIVKQK